MSEALRDAIDVTVNAVIDLADKWGAVLLQPKPAAQPAPTVDQLVAALKDAVTGLTKPDTQRDPYILRAQQILDRAYETTGHRR